MFPIVKIMIVSGHLLKFKRETLQMVILPKVETKELTENFQPDSCIRLSLHWLVVKEGWIVCETLINVSIVLRTGSQFNNTCYFFTSHFSPRKLCTIGISRFPIFQPSKYRTWTWFSCKTKTDKKLHKYSTLLWYFNGWKMRNLEMPIVQSFPSEKWGMKK